MYDIIKEAIDSSADIIISLDDTKESFLVSLKFPSPSSYTISQYDLVGDLKYIHEIIDKILGDNEPQKFAITECAFKKILLIEDLNRMLY